MSRRSKKHGKKNVTKKLRQLKVKTRVSKKDVLDSTIATGFYYHFPTLILHFTFYFFLFLFCLR